MLKEAVNKLLVEHAEHAKRMAEIDDELRQLLSDIQSHLGGRAIEPTVRDNGHPDAAPAMVRIEMDRIQEVGRASGKRW